MWCDIKGYEGMYQVSDEGVVKNIKTSHILKPSLTRGYCYITLSKNNNSKVFMLHRLVAIAFIDNPLNKKEVNHIDENPSNNKADNLMWVTPRENSNWGTRKERISETLKIRHKEGCFNEAYKKGALAKKHKVCQLNPKTKELINIFDGIKDITEKCGIHTGNVSSCCTGKRKTTHGYAWMYYEDYLNVN